MKKNVIEYLEESAKKYPDKVAYVDSNSEITYLQLKLQSQAIASKIAELNIRNAPIAVYMDKGVNCIISFLAAIYSGNFYTPIDYEMPYSRISKIFNTLQPTIILTNRESLTEVQKVEHDATVLIFEELIETKINKIALQNIQKNTIDTDPLYVLFTSGSTGVPKGVTISHRSVIDYTEWVSETFNITDEERFANQAPFYFDNSVLDIYSTLRNGSTMYIVPKSLFSFPIKLIEYLNENKINIIFWVPSVLNLVANLKALEVETPKYLKKILFAGEVMPNKQLNIWRKHLKEAIYANLYGPTEITVDCLYYIIDRKFKDSEPLPLGIPCENSNVLILNDKDELVGIEEIGEICVRGTSLALGYYNNFEKTSEVFVQNPLNKSYPELIYRTGDLAKYNSRGEVMYISRKDFQVKHLGYRIELGEIETIVGSLENVYSCCCLYDNANSKIVLFYVGQTDKSSLIKDIKSLLPKYMIPNKFIQIEKMPLNMNGKIDRLKLNYFME